MVVNIRQPGRSPVSVETFSGPGGHEFLVDMARANAFAARDLELNREGQTTRPQVIRVWLHALKPLRIAAGALAGWLIMILVIQAFLPSIAQFFVFKKLGIGALGPTIGIVGALAIALVKCTRKTILLIVDASEGKVASVVGRVAPSFEESTSQGLGRFRGEKDAVYFFCIRKDEFEVTSEAYSLLVSKYDTYRPLVRIYFTPRSHLLLSMEPVEGSSIAAQAETGPAQWIFSPSSEPMTVEPTYFAVRRNFDPFPGQWSADPALSTAAKPKPKRERNPRVPERAANPNGRPAAAGMPLPRHSGTPIRRSIPPAGSLPKSVDTPRPGR